MRTACSFFCVLTMYSWLLGVYFFPKWGALFPVLAAVLHLLFTRRIISFHPRLAGALVCFPFLYVALQITFAITQYWEGAQGVDFAIFVQAIDSCARTGSLMTSLLGLRFVNFLTHHFSPILFIPAGAAYLGAPAPYAGIACHGLAIAGMYFTAYRIARVTNWSRPYALLICAALFLHPTLRIGLSWEFRDEIFALPFVGLSYLFILRGKFGASSVMLLITMLCKETFFVIAPLVALCGFLHSFELVPRQRFSAGISFLFVSAVGFAGLVLYFNILPGWFFNSTFDPSTRIGDISTLLSRDTLIRKAEWAFKIFAPLCFVPILFPTVAKYALPTVVPLGAIAISGFEAMWNPLNYYSVAPVFILGIAIITGLGKAFPIIVDCALDFRLVVISLMISLSIGTPHNPAREIRRGLHIRHYAEELQRFVQRNQVVVANDYDLALLWDARHLTRLYHARRQRVVFDYVVSRVGQEMDIPAYIESSSEECFRNAIWFVRCSTTSSVE